MNTKNTLVLTPYNGIIEMTINEIQTLIKYDDNIILVYEDSENIIYSN